MRGGTKVVIALGIALLPILAVVQTRRSAESAGEVGHLGLSPQQEVALGASAMPEVLRQYGGEIDQPVIGRYVSEVGERLVKRSAAGQSAYPFEFHVLADPLAVDAFALPGGQISLTLGLLSTLHSEAELAAVLAHEIGHVVGRHGLQHLARQRFGKSLARAIREVPDQATSMGDGSGIVAIAVTQVVSMKYSREDELEADALAIRYMDQAQYDPSGMAELLELLATGRPRQRHLSFFSTHPNSENRLDRIRALIRDQASTGGEVGEERFREHVTKYLR